MYALSILLVIVGVACIPLGLALCVMSFIFAIASLISQSDALFHIAIISLVTGVLVVVVGFLFIHVSDRVMRKRVAQHCCGHCGYDLRGSPGPRCPECGWES